VGDFDDSGLLTVLGGRFGIRTLRAYM
jgi:hypothetical protein